MKKNMNQTSNSQQNFDKEQFIEDQQNQIYDVLNLESDFNFENQQEFNQKPEKIQSTTLSKQHPQLPQSILHLLEQQSYTNSDQKIYDLSLKQQQQENRLVNQIKHKEKNNLLNHQPNDTQKHNKNERQVYYSKAYRDRKKQQFNRLEQQNKFLKKRISQLQYRIRQQQLELSRFKYAPPQKQLTVQQLRRQFLKTTVSTFQRQITKNPLQQQKIIYTPSDSFYYEFLQIYNQNGFANPRKLRILKYHFDQIFQSLVTDSQRYLILSFSKSKHKQSLEPLQQFQPINKAFYEVFKLDEDLSNRLKQNFVKKLYEYQGELMNQCSQFYKSFQRLQVCLHKVHNFIRQTYFSNMDVARKRIELEAWFQYHKYGILMRRVREQWFDLIKKISQDSSKSKKHRCKKQKQSKKRQLNNLDGQIVQEQ